MINSLSQSILTDLREYRMLQIHADIGINGVKPENTFVLENGQVLALTNRKARIAGSVPSDDIYVDGSGIGDIGNVVIRDRKILSNDGLLAVVVNVDLNKKTVLQKPKVISRGFIYMKDSQELINEIQSSVSGFVTELIKNTRKSIVEIKNEVTEYLQSLIYDNIQRRPMIIPVIMNVKRG